MKETILILCSRPAFFFEGSKTDKAFMKSAVHTMIDTFSANEFKIDKKLNEIKQLPVSDTTKPKKVMNLYSTRSFADLFSSLTKLISETQWSNGVLSRMFVDTMRDNTKKLVKLGFSHFYGELTPQQEKLIERTYLFGKKIVKKMVKFLATKKTEKKGVYQGNLELTVLDDSYEIYKISPLIINGQSIKEKYLVKQGNLIFALKNLEDKFGRCQIVGQNVSLNNVNKDLCKVKVKPTMDETRCGTEIMQSKFPVSCELVSFLQILY